MRLLIIVISLLIGVQSEFVVPDAKVEVLPKGFRVSIPDQEGIKLFAFHGKLNEEMEGREGGTFSRDIIKPKNGRWTFVDKITKLKKGDILYYWTYVDYFDGKNKLGYTNDDQKYIVNVDDTSEINYTDVTPHVTPQIDVRGTCTVPVTETEGPVCAGALIFEDTFSHLDDGKWTVEQRYADAPDYEFVMYMKRPETVGVEDSNLKIKPVISDQVFGTNFVYSTKGYDFGDSCTGVKESVECKKKYRSPFILPPVISAQLSTINRFSFKYGKIEVRAKLPKGQWIYPELYLTPSSDAYGTKHDCSIRIAFTDGQNMRDLKGGPIVKSSTTNKMFSPKETSSNQDWCDNFHIFGVEWTPDVYNSRSWCGRTSVS
ncbi:unnamed protein product [Acanthoscelides obtectus]|uniref:Uncharacterized protein n=1 Tax=Acanthoscelides obtectus TaxID=200917 RepID=A0A9P0M2M8_ACAOB|nr:unnamed protein product [Acanthoscelides obtectus]CAK1635449.1 Beta-1,3-glucan-binding protein [Acanthoscelides obtectus]